VRQFRSKGKSPTKTQSFSDSDRGGDDKTTEIAAVRLLTRREHSSKDLKRKLQGKGHSKDVVERVVDKLTGTKLVSDERFAVNFVAYHGRRGHGPIRIRGELRQQGATDEAIDSALANADFDWGRVAADVRRRKFGDDLPRAMAERAKQARFLQYRGFSTDHIRAAMASMAVDPAEPTMLDSDFD
jgi:regulatory protein